MTLFQSYDLGGLALPNRIVMAPMTRSRSADEAADDMTALYYRQRSTAGLIISEGTPISREGQGYLFNPGIHTLEQIRGWKKTTESVHAAGGRIFAQLWHVGRVSHTSLQPGNKNPVSSTSQVARGAKAFGLNDQGLPGFVDTSPPRRLTTNEVARLVRDFSCAAENAVQAGFDGVELHGAGGYIFEQFLNPHVNDRNDKYSAQTMAGRLRFVLDVVDAVSERIGPSRVGIRFSPFGQLFDMPSYEETHETYWQLGKELSERRIAYVHLMDQSNFQVEDLVLPENRVFHKLLVGYKEAYQNGALIIAGGQTLESGTELVRNGTVDLVAYGQPFISNPDLVERFKNGWPLTPADRSTYYGGGTRGYIDYTPFVA
jgi:2,4-dienoyl-CoA reductase-like NADH-dependent reductase (Old Yellow Enzyme family)